MATVSIDQITVVIQGNYSDETGRIIERMKQLPVSVNAIICMLETISGRQLKIERRPAAQYWDKYSELFERPIAIDRTVIEREVNKHTHAVSLVATDDNSIVFYGFEPLSANR